jgi:hypothetical protein
MHERDGAHIRWLKRSLAGLFLFGISFGYLEATVVVYLRAMYEPLRQRLNPGRAPGELFPLTNPERIAKEAPESAKLVRIEIAREAATIIMLAAVALPVVGDRPLWLPSFAIAFGVWDIFYYVFLKMLIGWPQSLLTWDVLFLIPVPWTGPVLAPVLVSISLVVSGVAALVFPIKLGWKHWAACGAGGLVVLYSFMADYQHIMSGNVPRAFAWEIFLAGELIAAFAFAHGWRNSATRYVRGEPETNTRS